MSYGQEYGRICRFVEKGKVFDLGCGLGGLLDVFPSQCWDKYGMEISDYAKSHLLRKGIRLVDWDMPSNQFDLVILRGVLQHLDTPLYVLQQCIRLLKSGGYMVFLATPNTNSICYRLFRELSMLDPPRNYMLPSDTMLTQILTNFGLEVVCLEYPYKATPYARPLRDHVCFLLRLFGVRSRFAFWGNMMECYARKG